MAKARAARGRRRVPAAAGRKRHQTRAHQGTRADLEAKVEEIRRSARPDAPVDLIRDYVQIGIALAEELAGRRDANAVRELSRARVLLAEHLGITPHERRFGSVPESVSEAVARATVNTRRFLRENWKSLQEEIRDKKPHLSRAVKRVFKDRSS